MSDESSDKPSLTESFAAATPYTPLKASDFWHDMEASAERYWKIFPTKLHVFEQYFFTNGNGYDWVNGKLADVCNPDKPIPDDAIWDAPHRPQVAGVETNDPAQNPLFAAIPEVPAQKFLQSMSADAFTHAESDRLQPGQVYPICQYAECYTIPLSVDVHYLAADMLMLKHVWNHPEAFDAKYGLDEQKDFVRASLNSGFDIIARRGLAGDFGRACGELGAALPDLTAMSDKHIAEADERYARDLEHRKFLASLTPEQKKRMLEGIEEIMKEITAGDAPKTQAAKPPAL